MMTCLVIARGAARHKAVSQEEQEMRLFTRSLATALMTAGCCLSISVTNVPAQSPPSGSSVSAPHLSDQKLSAAAAAVEHVDNLLKAYQQRIAEAEASNEKARLLMEADNELTKAITAQGLSVDEYSSILDVARYDPEIRGKILQRIPPFEN
jgi:hypothetical protein